MDFQRLILFVALSFTLLLLWQAWQRDYGPVPPNQATSQVDEVPAMPGAGSTPGAMPQRPGLNTAQRIQVQTDVFKAEIDTYGGDLRRVELLNYPVSVSNPDEPVTLLNDQGSEVFVAQSGLLSAAGDSVPNHHSVFTAEANSYSLTAGQDTLSIRLHWQSPAGVQVDKIYTFHRGSYLVDVSYDIRNQGAAPLRASMYRQLMRSRPADTGSAFIYTYTGGVIYGPEVKYEKVEFDDMEDADLSRDITGGWAAMIQHYFLGAWVPPQDRTHHYYTRALGDSRFILGMTSPATDVAPGQTENLGARLYVGPKLQERLAEVAPGLELTVDYGILTFIAKPLFWALELIHGLLGNWGWAIVVLTILIKLAFYKLSATSYKSMAHMRKVQPRLMAIKERYGDDRQKLNEAMMKLYREEKINPLGGCLPILVQIPVFIALYWMLLESVELRQADFMLWINDLSSADPYFVLPILMGATMLIQHRLNPTPLDPIQAKVMMILPLVFTVFFAFFPAGLVLYWVVNNTLSIAQQWYITRYVVKA